MSEKKPQNPSALIVENGVIASIEVVRKLPWIRWPTILPFVVLYLIELVLYVDPTLVWGTATYIIWLTYIDFFHSVLFPITIFIQAICSLLTVWSLGVTTRILYRKVPWSVVLEIAKKPRPGLTAEDAAQLANSVYVVVRTKPHKGESDIVQLQSRLVKRVVDGVPTLKVELYFLFQQRKWWLDTERGIFVKPAFPTRLPMRHYVQKAGHQSEQSRQDALDAFGANEIHVDIPSFQELFVDHALAPFFVFQMFCVMLWCMDEYWMYSLFTGFMMVVMECTVVMQRLRNMKTMRQMGEQPDQHILAWRNGSWKPIPNKQLLPLDVIVIPMNCPAPCDLVLVRGSAVCNESMLTGESTPQLKEPIPLSDDHLSMKQHSRHVLFAGTNILLSASNESTASGSPSSPSGYPTPPLTGSGAVGVVLRVGFETKQGKLVRTIIHSQSRISENSGEAFLFIFFLLCFALVAVGYLLKRGIADPSRSRWKLFLSCTQILTSVVPPELPMELSLAVNTSLVALMRQKIFCTEPFRIPFAGKITCCCFDKTGTLTTDEMLFAGIDVCDAKKLRTTLESIPLDAEEVLAGCHSLVLIDAPEDPNSPPGTEKKKELAGDAMEKAAVESLKWNMAGDTISRDDVIPPKDSTGGPATPGSATSNASPTVKRPGGRRQLKVRTRFPFNPTLRRMSCVVSDASGDRFVVAKGSPESIESILKAVPATYREVSERYAKRGLRVIALAKKSLDGLSRSEMDDISREKAESDLLFAGFAVFHCPLKKDSRATIENLQAGSNRCVIITGDSVDTAVAVAKDVTILEERRDVYVCAPIPGAASSQPTGCIQWVILDKGTESDGEKPQQMVVNASALTDTQFEAVLKAHANSIAVWARCAPSQKESIVAELKHCGEMVLMAGDGTNDVGGLKQAHVGIAVLNCALLASAKNTEKAMYDQASNMKITPMPAPLRADAGFKERMAYAMQEAKHKAETQRQQTIIKNMEKQKAIGAGPNAGPPNLTPMPPPLRADAGFKERMTHAMQEAKHKAELKNWEKLQQQKASGAATSTSSSGGVLQGLVDGSLTQNPDDPMALANSMFNDLDDTTGAPMVKLGDASIAAPFTCKSKNMSSVVDIVRMGRCTLVTTLQMYKILALNCLISAYSMSVLHSDGVKYGDKQMMLSGMLIAICFLLLSRSQPLQVLSKERPITKVFHPYMVLSILGQFAVHLYSLHSSVLLVQGVDPEATMSQSKEVDNPDFRPTLLNSIVFLMTTIMTVTTFTVNYRGRPFMTGLWENKPMLWSVSILSVIIFYCAAEIDPDTNQLLEIVPFPSEEFRNNFLALLFTDVAGAFAAEKISRLLFLR